MRSFLLCFVISAVFLFCVHAYNNDNEELDKRGNPPASRLSNMYGFGLGKRPYSNYNFGLGKRADVGVLETDDLPFSSDESYEDISDYDVEKRSRFNFGLGKRYSKSKLNSKFNFGLGKRSLTDEEDDIEKRSKYNFGLGKRDNNGLSTKSNGQEEAEVARSSALGTGGKHLPSAYAYLLKAYGPAKSSNFVGKRGKTSQNYPFLGKRLPVYDFGLGKRSSL